MKNKDTTNSNFNNSILKIYLKELNISDVKQEYVNWLNDYEIVKFTSQKNLKHTLDNVKNFVLEKKNSKNEFLFGIFLQNNNEWKHVGNIKLGVINFIDKSAHISYFIGDKNSWGKGIATKAIEEVIKIASKKFKLKKLIAGTFETNASSIRVLEKNNFVIEKILKNKLIFENKRYDHFFYGLSI